MSSSTKVNVPRPGLVISRLPGTKPQGGEEFSPNGKQKVASVFFFANHQDQYTARALGSGCLSSAIGD